MDKKIQEITDKVYQEGVVRGQQAAEQLRNESETERARLIEEGQRERDRLIETGKREAQQWKRNVEAEVKLAAHRAMEELRLKIADIVMGRVAENAVQELKADRDFVGKLIVALAENMGQEARVRAARAQDVEAYVAAQASDVLQKGVKIEEMNGETLDFSITAEREGYRMDFSEATFRKYIGQLLKDDLKRFLFET